MGIGYKHRPFVSAVVVTQDQTSRKSRLTEARRYTSILFDGDRTELENIIE